MFVATGVGPFGPGRALQAFCAEDQNHDYAHNRYQYETDRHYKILDGHLRPQLHGRRQLFDRRHGAVGLGADGAVQARRRCLCAIPEREAAGGRDLGAAGGGRAIALKDKFTFKAEMDDEARAQHVQAHDDESRLIARRN